MHKLSDHSIAVVVLAAGRGERMGERPKLMLPLRDGEPVVEKTIRNAMDYGPSELVVVVRPDQPTLSDAVRARFISRSTGGLSIPVRLVPNPRYPEGMATSLAAGIAALGDDAQGAVVILGDMPYIDRAIIEGLVWAYLKDRKPITIPVYGREVGPPTLFAREIFPELLPLTGDVGGRQLIAKHPEMAAGVPFREGQRPPDLDTPEDYEAFLC
jgi:molybdenum cofactor cytidylyltransferase